MVFLSSRCATVTAGPSRSLPDPTRLAHRVTPMEDHLEVEVRDGGTGRAEVVARGDRSRAAIGERPVRRLDLLEDPVTLAIEACRRRDGEDGIALELHEGEVGRQALDDGVQEGTEHGVGCRDARAEVDPVFLLDAGHEARVAGDVGEQQVPLACRRICLRRRRGSLRSLHVLPLPGLGGRAHRHHAELLHHRQGVEDTPVLVHEAIVAEAEHVDELARERSSRSPPCP